MKKRLISSLIGLSFTTSIYAAEQIELNDIVVTATRTPQPKESIISDVTVINQEEIERSGQSTFVELLQSQPSIEVDHSGGAGTATGIFIRGTNSNQVVVLIDGVRIGSATTGTTAFENIPLSQIEHIEILRGSATSLYGQDAIGGVIQIFTKKGTGLPTLNAAVGYGSFNTKSAQAGFSGSVQDTSFSFNVSSLDTDSFSAKRISTGAQADKDGYRNLSASASISHKIMEGHELGIQLFSSKGHANYDSSSTFNNYVDLSQLSYGLFSKNQLLENWKSTIRLGASIDDQDNQISTTSNSSFKTEQKQYSWQNDLNLPVGTLTLLYDRLEQKVITKVPFEKTRRNTDGFMVGYWADLNDHSLQTSLRNDHSSLFGSHMTGNIGYGYKFSPNWRLSGSYGKAFKAPTFNDQYYVDEYGAFNNPNVKPEKSENFEASLRYVDNSSSASITGYKNRISNFITLDSNFLASNVNAEIEGISLAASKNWDNWLFKSSLDIQSPLNTSNQTLLARRANRHGTIGLSYALNDFNVGSDVIASSKRYNTADEQYPLAGYAIINLYTDYKINKDWTLLGRLNNALNKQYALSSTASSFSPNGSSYNPGGSNLFISVRYAPK